MNRAEAIKQVAENYASQMCKNCSARLYCKGRNKKCAEYREQVKVYTDGAKFADEHPKDIWHSIDDIPTGNYDIICKDKTNYWACSWEYFYENYPNWEQFVKTMNVEKWLYMHEL